MGTALIGIAILLSQVLALLAVPLEVAFRVEHAVRTEGRLGVRWLFGLVRFHAALPGPPGPGGRRERRSGKKSGTERPARGARGAVALLGQSDFRRRVAGFAREILRSLHARDLYLRIRVGLGDPADTGRLWGLLGPVSGYAAGLENATVRLEPEFTDRLLEVESRGELRFVPLRLIALALSFAASPATLRAVGAWRRA